MRPNTRWSRVLVIVGLIAIAVGTIDPLEGSVLILAGIALAALGAFLEQSPQRRQLYLALALGIVGVGLLWGFSAVGGFGGRTGRSMWWSVTLIPYPIAWALAIGAAVQLLRRKPA